MTDRVLLDIAGRSVRFVSDCAASLDYLRTYDHLVGIRPFRVLPDDTALDVPTVRYANRPDHHASFDPETVTLNVAFPWEPVVPAIFDPAEPFRNVLLYSVRMMLEYARQEAGEYTVHASTVVRDGQAVVFSGDAEAGKTTTALDLCHRHGFSLFANDQTVVGLHAGRPSVVHGDKDVSLRLSSVNRYSSEMAQRMFAGGGSQPDPWEVKRDVDPSELGIASAAQATALRLFVRIRLDDTLAESVVSLMSSHAGPALSDRSRRALFRSKVELFGEFSKIIRGAAFTPMRDSDLSLFDLYIPSLDRQTFLARRVRFMNALYESPHTSVLHVRGPLEACSQAIVENFEKPADRGDL